MKRSYYITLASVLAVICLQAIYIFRLHTNYVNEQLTEINNVVIRAIGDELHNRGRKTAESPDKSFLTLKPMNEMSAKEKDSIFKKEPIIKGKTAFNIDSIRKNKLGETQGDILMQIMQDIEMTKGNSLKLPLLKQMVDQEANNKFKYRILSLDKNKKVIASFGEENLSSTYLTRLYPIGTKGLQYIQLQVSIPMSSFLVSQIWTLSASALFMLIALFGLFFQLTKIREENKLLEERKRTVNGTIHDLKSPLNSIILLLGWMKKKAENEQQKQVIEQNLLSTRRMVCNVEALLQLAQSGARALVLNEKAIDLIKLIDSQKIELDRLYYNKPHTIIIKNRLPEGTIIKADAMYMENVFHNLIENALKYSEPGVIVEVLLCTENGMLSVKVKDNGWGIPSKYIKKLFKPFFRVPSEKTQHIKGSGIGLAQTRAIIKAHHGNINITCPPSGGTIVSFQIPLTQTT